MQVSESAQNKQRLWTHTLAPNFKPGSRLSTQATIFVHSARSVQAAAHKGPQPSKPACNNSSDREDARDFVGHTRETTR